MTAFFEMTKRLYIGYMYQLVCDRLQYVEVERPHRLREVIGSMPARVIPTTLNG